MPSRPGGSANIWTAHIAAWLSAAWILALFIRMGQAGLAGAAAHAPVAALLATLRHVARWFTTSILILHVLAWTASRPGPGPRTPSPGLLFFSAGGMSALAAASGFSIGVYLLPSIVLLLIASAACALGPAPDAASTTARRPTAPVLALLLAGAIAVAFFETVGFSVLPSRPRESSADSMTLKTPRRAAKAPRPP